uniref:Putative tetraterpene cyclase n=1 Tax=Streptomyces argenteolus TaxID=67274 RepID=A9ZNV5_9ACTN|nr:putative tetraterpene cyclase [Streptomyces argenteolus]
MSISCTRASTTDGSWCDRLASSAVSTALSVLALHEVEPAVYRDEIEAGLLWLHDHQRADGGWSDADEDPPSSKSGTAFAIAAMHAIDPDRSAGRIRQGMDFLEAAGGVHRIPGMRGPGPKSWPAAAAIAWALVGLRQFHEQPRQPIEVMLLPQVLRNKVSVALPGVLGIGLMQTRLLPAGRLRRFLWRFAEPRALAWLRDVQGENGGIEECPMLGALILIALHRAGMAEDVQKGCLSYLLETRRPDGSWAVDRDLEISVTRYAVTALAECVDVASEPRLRRTRDWLLDAQWRKPFTPLRIPSGGWGWAMPSGWPEPDDTAGVLEALAFLDRGRLDLPARVGLRWLTVRQDSRGSWCGWVRNASILNDKPCPAVTSQVVTAMHRYGLTDLPGSPIRRALDYVATVQTPEGAFPSLWFRKHVFGTARVLETYALLGLAHTPSARRAHRWLLDNQRDDGSWPAGADHTEGTAEETAWALYALLASGLPPSDPRAVRGIQWLATAQHGGTWRPSPVGLYFDDLRYNSDLIAHTFALRALGSWLRRTRVD